MLSRKHAIFRQNAAGNWTVRDNKSLNGIHVNGRQLKSQTLHPIVEGDIVQLAVAPDISEPPDFVFTLVKEHLSPADAKAILKSYKRKRKMGNKGKLPGDESQDFQNENTQRSDNLVRDCGNSRKRVLASVDDQKRKMCDNIDAIPGSEENPSTSGLPPPPKRQRQLSESEKELTEKLEEQKRLAAIKAKEAEDQLNELMQKLQEQQAARQILEQQLKEKEHNILKELDSEKADFQSRRQQMQQEMEKAMESQVRMKEQDLEEQLKIQQEAQAKERQHLENALKEEWENRLREKEEDLTKLQQDMQSTLESQVKEKETLMMEQLRTQREELMWEKQRVETQLQEEWAKKLEEKDKSLQALQEDMKRTLEEEIRQKEKLMLDQLESQRAVLQSEKERVESNLQKELERKLNEKNRDLQQKLEGEKSELEEVIAQKEKEYANLKDELYESKLEKERQEKTLQNARAEALQNITDVMETELTCSICSEFFMQATTLNCSHSFCQYCILMWMNKKRECPVCRSAIVSHNRSIVLDNYIDKMVEKLCEDMKDRREEIILERKRQQAERTASSMISSRLDHRPVVPAAPIPVHHHNNNNNRGYHHHQNHRRPHHDNRNTPPRQNHHDHREHNHQPNHQPRHRIQLIEPIVISDGEVSDPIEPMDDNYDPGLPGHYFGGYGNCHRCGRRGHWSRGCPY